MKQVSKERIGRILRLYEGPYIFVNSVKTEFPTAKGNCFIGKTRYTKERLEHVTAIEAQFCINQLSYVAFADWVEEKRFSNLIMSLDQYIYYMKEHMLIARTETQIQFKDKIRADKPFSIEGTLNKFKRQENLWVAVMDYVFENGKAKGRMTLCLEK